MTLSKQEEPAIWQVYETYWQSYLSGDIPTLASQLADEYTQIGSVETEVFDNKKDAVHFIETTIDQVARKLEMRNRVKKFEQFDTFVLITEQTDLYVLTEGEWVYYAKFRASSFLRKIKGQWKFIHQHSSMPDIRADEGENIATEKISRENIELRDAIKRRTIELEQKNQELAMETSLERVRTMAMGMRKPDDLLGICEVLFNELRSMDFTELRNAMINIHNDEKSTFINYDYSEEIGPSINHLNYTIHPVIEKQIKQIRSTHDAFSETVFSGQDLEDWKAFRKKIGEKDDPRINNVDALYYYFYSIGTGAIGISTFGPISTEKLEQLKRFRNVFEFAYRRYMDVVQAEIQVRESRIEIALERVRSRTMAMFESEELSDVAEVLFAQISQLGVMPDRISICVIDETNQTYQVWATDQAGSQLEVKLVAKLDEKTTIRHLYADWKAGKKFSLIELQGDDLKNWIEYLRQELGMPISTDHLQGRRFHNVAHFSHGWLNLSSSEPLDGEIHDLLQRFSSVFSLTYTRFLDLQKAEAQAKEAQIEAAIERVRASSMGIHKSKELIHVVRVLDKEIHGLGIEINGTQIITDFENPEEGSNSWFKVEGQDYLEKFHITPFDHPIYNRFINEIQKGFYFFTERYSKEEKNEFFKLLYNNTDFKATPKERQDFVYSAPVWIRASVLSKNSILILQRFFPKEFSEEEGDIFKRFGKVFEQAYTRFLDLQKAEAQAREAQIEAALERIRSRSMALQKSSELEEVITVVFNEWKRLGLELYECNINIIDKDIKAITIWSHGWGETVTIKGTRLQFFDHPFLIQFVKDYKKQARYSTIEMDGEDSREYLRRVFAETDFKYIADEYKQALLSIGHVFINNAFMKYGSLDVISSEALPDDKSEILIRFAKVFEQTYTRFLDLEKAESQAREAQIEVSLERVRSRSMAMHKSDELLDAGEIIFIEMQKLGIESLTAGLVIIDKEGKNGLNYAPNPLTKKLLPLPIIIPHNETIHLQQVVENWKKGNPFFIVELDEGETIKHQTFIAKRSINFPLNAAELIAISPAKLFLHNFYFKEGYILIVGGTKLTVEQTDIMLRFAKVFQQTYTRFLDLQKAEAQAREGQIEAALERVRSRSMGMQKSEELKEVIKTVYQQLTHLKINLDHAGFVVDYTPGGDWHFWVTDEHDIPSKITHPYFESVWATQFNKAKEKGEDIFATRLNFEEKNKFYNKLLSYVPGLPEASKDFYLSCPGLAVSTVLLENVSLYIENYSAIPYSDEENAILMRFGKVFQQTYTRFLDLQKAESQTREVKIEAALERVRSRAMAMQLSSELSNLIDLVYKEMGLLDIILQRCFIMIFDPLNKSFTWWMASNEAGSSQRGYLIKHHEHKPHLAYIKGWQDQNAKWEYTLQGIEKKEWDNFLFKETELVELPPQIIANMTGTACAYLHSSFSNFGCICAASVEPLTGDYFDILSRFSKVFDQTYTRFLDLQKAEAQAREATIEAALEKVRGKAMAMHNSNDLIDTASIVFTELRNLGIQSFRTGVGLLTKGNRKVTLYSATSTAKGDNLSLVGSAMLEGHEVLSKFYESWIANEDYFPVLKGEMLKTYYEKINATFSVPSAQSDNIEHFGYFLQFSEGLFYGWSEKPYTESEIKILKRFRVIVDLTFRRYFELQKAEANALEALRSASLDRVRAETASMRTTADLEKITPMIWNELSTLGVPFIRCGVFIMDEAQELIHTFLSTPDGKAIASFLLPYKASAELEETVTHWRKKEMYQQHWDEAAFAEWTKNLMQQGFITSSDSYATEHRPTNLYLHFLPFLQGMLYVGNIAALIENDLHLVQNLADAFSTAYARYEDFNKLEAAKEQVDKTLTDLKQAQSQLVQAEKMASLGELTAGIAHEIQNPLNFVNNFSEINTELSDEIVEAAKKGDLEEIIQLAGDIKSNQDKISEHGRRADAIVKGMLQHSRSSSGVKEPTDINKLADEYFRLAYHGLRAKDKSFNATLHTDFDPAIGMIPIMPQDIGRVLLNLYNNAFYVVAEKKQLFPTDYEPAVSVHSIRIGDKIEISVKDNGMGIPHKVLDKIFQPFFTTKPTGQGTGLGLSLSYDIVKAHGGELRVATTEGEGSEFIIQLNIV